MTHAPKCMRMRGGALIICLMLLVAVLMLGISAADNALQGEKSARSERDRQIAFQSAEAGLLDAELDIQGSPDEALSRSARFSAQSAEGFPEEEAACGAGMGDNSVGLCRPAAREGKPVWQSVDFLAEGPDNLSASYGRFTGRRYPAAIGGLPSRSPRYIVEIKRYTAAGESAEAGDESYFYRITAVGTGTRETTQVALQTLYRKAE